MSNRDEIDNVHVEERISPSITGPPFPSRFLKGVGLSVWQNSADGDSPGPSNWQVFAAKKNYFGSAQFKDSAWKHSNGFWDKYEEDIKMAKLLGCNSFRFSFEWARFEPLGPGQVDQSAVDHYHRMIDCMIDNGLEPMCTLHHFTHPQWFEECGGFAVESNTPLFVEYCKRVFSWFAPKIKLWATFNEPTCFAFVGYIAGLWCPGKLMKFKLAGEVLLNLLKAHIIVYKILKATTLGGSRCIGLVHQHVRFMTRSNFAPHAKLLCDWMTYWFACDQMLRFFSTGIYKWEAPFRGTVVKYEDRSAPNSIDWWGINYYSYPCVSGFFGMGASNDNEPVADNSFRLYPPGLYSSIKEASSLGVPIFITETGSADKAGKNRRQLIEGHVSMVEKAVREGMDVRGMYYWTLMDNIEWHEGFNINFGLYEWSPAPQTSTEQVMRLRAGSEALVETYHTWPESLVDFKAFVVSQSSPVKADKQGEVSSLIFTMIDLVSSL